MKKSLSLCQSYLLLAVFPAYFIIVGLFMQPPSEILSGLRSIIREPDFLITDYFVIGGIGAAFLNAGLITLILLFILYPITNGFPLVPSPPVISISDFK